MKSLFEAMIDPELFGVAATPKVLGMLIHAQSDGLWPSSMAVLHGDAKNAPGVAERCAVERPRLLAQYGYTAPEPPAAATFSAKRDVQLIQAPGATATKQ